MVEPLKNRDGSTMVIADRDPGDVVVVLAPRPRVVAIGAIMGIQRDKHGRRRGAAQAAMVQDVDPETTMLVTRDDRRRRLRVWYTIDASAPVVAVVQTIDHRRAMQHLKYTRRRLLSVGGAFDLGGEVDPIRNHTRVADDDVPF